MRMFWKLFLSFWLTIILGGAMSVAAISTFRHLPGFLFHDDMTHRLAETAFNLTRLYGEAARQLYRTGGRDEHEAFIVGLARNAGIELTLVETDGRTITGRPLSAEIAALARRA